MNPKNENLFFFNDIYYFAVAPLLTSLPLSLYLMDKVHWYAKSHVKEHVGNN